MALVSAPRLKLYLLPLHNILLRKPKVKACVTRCYTIFQSICARSLSLVYSSLFDPSLCAPASLSQWQAHFCVGMEKKFQCPLSQSSDGAQTAPVEWTLFWICKWFCLTTIYNIVPHVCWCHMLETEQFRRNTDKTHPCVSKQDVSLICLCGHKVSSCG